MAANDRALGMHRRITRRDFLNGAAASSAALLALRSAAAVQSEEYYPPILTGMRGDHDGLYKVPHSIRDHTFWDTAAAPVSAGEEYDLVIVGGGISGLAAAYFYRKATGPNTRILILENHDDF